MYYRLHTNEYAALLTYPLLWKNYIRQASRSYTRTSYDTFRGSFRRTGNLKIWPICIIILAELELVFGQHFYQGYVRIEIRSAERIFFLRNSRCGAKRISVLAKTHGLLQSGFSALTMTRIGAERIIRTNLWSRIRTDLPEIVTERIGSDIRSWKMSRIIRERISAF